MKSLQYLSLLASLIKIGNSQALDATSATLLAWRTYGEFVQQYLTAGAPLTPGVDFIYVTPPSLSSIRGGSPVPYAVQNFDLFTFADSLQNKTVPLLNPIGPSYVQNLEM